MAEGDVRDPHVRRAVAVMERPELEDKHLHLMEENLLLKKHARSQEEKMKKMATKLLRLTSDEKRESRRDGQPLSVVQLRQRDIEMEEMMEELHGRTRELERQNSTLKNKVLVLKQQLETRGRRHTPYDHVQPRISTGLSRRGSQKSLSNEDISTKRRNAGIQATPAVPQYGHSLLEEARKDNQELEELALQLKQEIALLNAEAERDREEVKLQCLQHEEEKLKLQEQLQTHLATAQKSSIQEDVELIKLQRELREKSVRLQSLQAQYLTLERSLEVMKGSHSKVLQEMETLNGQLKEERSRSSSLQSELRVSAVSQRAVSELQEMVADLRAEKELLKQANDRLMKSALDSEKDDQHRSRVRALQDRIRQLEATAKTELSEKTRVYDKLSSEREVSERLDRELQELRASYQQLREEHQQLQNKMKFFSKESSVDWGEVEEALVLVRGRRGEGVEPLSFLEKVEDEEKVDYHREVQELRSAHADTINELGKTRKLLALQHNINKDYKNEVESLKVQVGELKRDHERRLQEYTQLLDIRAARIKKLEGQLKDIAYGTRPYKIDTSKFEYAAENELEESIELERGQNLLQFHISQALLSSEALSLLNTTSPALFVTLGFFHFETQVTPVVQGARPLFNFTTNFVVTVNDTLLNHLQKGCVSVELHQAFGMRFQRLAVGSVKCRELINSAGGKVHGKVVFTGVDSLQQCVNVGSLEYWMRLKLPMTQAVRLYQERSKALSLMEQEATDSSPALSHQDTDYNELTVTIVRCSGLKSRDTAHPPSPYAMYKFYTFPDHDTEITPNSTHPVFNNSRGFPLSMDQHLHTYLRSEVLEVYVFDDMDPMETSYMGVAQVPLTPLTQNTPISGVFQLTGPFGSTAGAIELSLKWKLPYLTQSTSSPPHLHLPPPSVTAAQDIGTRSAVPKREAKLEVEAPLQKVKPTHVVSGEEEDRTEVDKVDTAKLKQQQESKTGVSEEFIVSTVVNVAPSTMTALSGEKEDSELQRTEAAVESQQAIQPQSEVPKSKPSGAILPSVGIRPKPVISQPTSSHEPIPETNLEISEAHAPALLPLYSAELGGRTDTTAHLQIEPLTEVSPIGVRENVPSGGAEESNDFEGGPPSEHGDYPESVSVSVTECSEEGEGKEEIEECLSAEEDTMFEETVPQPEAEDDFSGLSAHSSDEQPPPTPTPAQPSVILVEGGEGESPELSPSGSEDGNPVTSNTLTEQQQQQHSEEGGGTTSGPDTLSITVVGFTVEVGSLLPEDPTISQLFVEYQFLNFDEEELETPTISEPAPGETGSFSFRKVFQLDAEQRSLLAAMLKPGDPSEGRIMFTLVSDPEDQQADCTEIGTAEVDLHTILQRGEDLIDESIDVLSLDDDPEVIGYLSVSIEALSLLRCLEER